MMKFIKLLLAACNFLALGIQAATGSHEERTAINHLALFSHQVPSFHQPLHHWDYEWKIRPCGAGLPCPKEFLNFATMTEQQILDLAAIDTIDIDYLGYLDEDEPDMPNVWKALQAKGYVAQGYLCGNDHFGQDINKWNSLPFKRAAFSVSYNSSMRTMIPVEQLEWLMQFAADNTEYPEIMRFHAEILANGLSDRGYNYAIQIPRNAMRSTTIIEPNLILLQKLAMEDITNNRPYMVYFSKYLKLLYGRQNFREINRLLATHTSYPAMLCADIPC